MLLLEFYRNYNIKHLHDETMIHVPIVLSVPHWCEFQIEILHDEHTKKRSQYLEKFYNIIKLNQLILCYHINIPINDWASINMSLVSFILYYYFATFFCFLFFVSAYKSIYPWKLISFFKFFISFQWNKCVLYCCKKERKYLIIYSYCFVIYFCCTCLY